MKTVEKPLESDDAIVILQHENEIEAIFTDENLRFYCGKGSFVNYVTLKIIFLNLVTIFFYMEKIVASVKLSLYLFLFLGDDHGGISIFDNGKFKFTMNIVEHVKGLFVEKNYVYTLANMDLRSVRVVLNIEK